MANYRTTGQVNYNGKLIAPGKPITFKAGDEDVIGELLEAKAIEIGTAEKSDDTDGGAPKPLAQMNLAELMETATAEGVTFADNATKAQLVDAILAKRAEASTE